MALAGASVNLASYFGSVCLDPLRHPHRSLSTGVLHLQVDAAFVGDITVHVGPRRGAIEQQVDSQRSILVVENVFPNVIDRARSIAKAAVLCDAACCARAYHPIIDRGPACKHSQVALCGMIGGLVFGNGHAVLFLSPLVNPVSLKELVFHELISRPAVNVIPIVAHPCLRELQSEGDHVRNFARFNLGVIRVQPLRKESHQVGTLRVMFGPFVALPNVLHQIAVTGGRCVLEEPQQLNRVGMEMAAILGPAGAIRFDDKSSVLRIEILRVVTHVG